MQVDRKLNDDHCKGQHDRAIKTAIPCHTHRKAHSNHTARQISNAPVLAGLENTHQLQCSGYIAHWLRFFQTKLPVLIFARFVVRQCFSRILSGMDCFLVCAQALPNPVEKACRETRGFTSCSGFFSFDERTTTEILRSGSKRWGQL